LNGIGPSAVRALKRYGEYVDDHAREEDLLF